jgi:hypothetical protein
MPVKQKQIWDRKGKLPTNKELRPLGRFRRRYLYNRSSKESLAGALGVYQGNRINLTLIPSWLTCWNQPMEDLSLFKAESLPSIANILSSSGPCVLPVSAARRGINNSLPLNPVFSFVYVIVLR